MIGDLPEADAKPPSNVLFICKLNPVTTEVGQGVCGHDSGPSSICGFLPQNAEIAL
jgi:hypothetical protein